MKKFAITIQLLLLFAVLSITMQAQQWQSIWNLCREQQHLDRYIKTS